MPASVLIFPVLHRSHDEDPVLRAIVPALQMAHSAASAVGAARPTGQSSQATEPFSFVYFPGEQSSHSPWAVLRLE